jgi:hypothetical protein
MLDPCIVMPDPIRHPWYAGSGLRIKSAMTVLEAAMTVLEAAMTVLEAAMTRPIVLDQS